MGLPQSLIHQVLCTPSHPSPHFYYLCPAQSEMHTTPGCMKDKAKVFSDEGEKQDIKKIQPPKQKLQGPLCIALRQKHQFDRNKGHDHAKKSRGTLFPGSFSRAKDPSVGICGGSLHVSRGWLKGISCNGDRSGIVSVDFYYAIVRGKNKYKTAFCKPLFISGVMYFVQCLESKCPPCWLFSKGEDLCL